jgi:DNA-directed RNA polymerase subunit M/transcription elongation factor TFIIS
LLARLARGDEMKDIEISDYVLLKEDKHTHCGKCKQDQDIYLLANTKTTSCLPRFYICFNCQFVGEVGNGKVLKK